MMSISLLNVIELLLTAIAALVATRWVLRMFDRMAGRSFKNDYLPKIEKDPQALANYLSYRHFGACVLVGLIFSKVI